MRASKQNLEISSKGRTTIPVGDTTTGHAQKSRGFGIIFYIFFTLSSPMDWRGSRKICFRKNLTPCAFQAMSFLLAQVGRKAVVHRRVRSDCWLGASGLPVTLQNHVITAFGLASKGRPRRQDVNRQWKKGHGRNQRLCLDNKRKLKGSFKAASGLPTSCPSCHPWR
jgi:hypothetical protein